MTAILGLFSLVIFIRVKPGLAAILLVLSGLAAILWLCYDIQVILMARQV